MPDNASIPIVGYTMLTRQPIYGYRRGTSADRQGQQGIPERVPITNPEEYWRYHGLGEVQGDRTLATQGEADRFVDDARYGDILGIYRGAADLAHDQFNQQGDYLQGTIGEVNQMGQAGRQTLLSRETQQLGAAGTMLRGRGLGNTTVLDNARRGIHSDTNQALTAHDEMTTGLRIGARNRMSDFMGERTQAETGLRLAQAQPRQRRSELYHALQMARIAAAGQGGGGGSSAQIAASIFGGIGSAALAAAI